MGTKKNHLTLGKRLLRRWLALRCAVEAYRDPRTAWAIFRGMSKAYRIGINGKEYDFGNPYAETPPPLDSATAARLSRR